MPGERDSQPSLSQDNSINRATSAENLLAGDKQAPNDMPQVSQSPIESDAEDELGAQLAMQDVHSQPATPVDLHSVRAEAPATATTAQAGAPLPPTAENATTTPITTPKSPVVEATVQATQTAVNTAVQASHRVTATVQQQAQRITVAPRKAIYRGKRFMIAYGVAVGVTGAVAVLARRYRYFPADIGIARALQRPNFALYDGIMKAVSDLGWRWISVGTRASITTLMWAAGFRMESAFTLSTWTGDMLTGLIKAGVVRPRPTRDLVRVVSDLQEASFPSGHVVHYVTFYGFLFYLVFIHLKQRWFRTALLTLLAGIILLVGPSRIYMGQHWPSDVGGAYLVGTLWLGVIIIAYLETKANYTLHTYPPFLVKRPAQLK